MESIASSVSVPEILLECFADDSAREACATDPVSALTQRGYRFSHAELSALLTLRGPLLDFSDERLGKALRRPRSSDRPEHRAAVESLLGYRQAVIEATATALGKLAPPPAIRALFDKALSETSALSQLVPCLPAVDFPAAVCASCTGTMERALPVSVSLLLYYMGISLYDDIVDRDLGDEWKEFPEPEVGFAAITMFSGLPVLAFEYLDHEHITPDFIRRAAYWLQRAAYDVNVGQYLDVSLGLGPSCTPLRRSRTRSNGGSSRCSAREAKIRRTIPRCAPWRRAPGRFATAF